MKIKKFILDCTKNMFQLFVLIGLLGLCAIGVSIVFAYIKINPIIGILVIALISIIQTICKVKRGKRDE